MLSPDLRQILITSFGVLVGLIFAYIAFMFFGILTKAAAPEVAKFCPGLGQRAPWDLTAGGLPQQNEQVNLAWYQGNGGWRAAAGCDSGMGNPPAALIGGTEGFTPATRMMTSGCGNQTIDAQFAKNTSARFSESSLQAVLAEQ